MQPILLVDVNTQNRSLETEILSAIKQAMYSTLILGPEMQQFERAWAYFLGSTYAFGVASGTDALFLSLKAAGIQEGDEVITVPNTFVATALAIQHCGAKPVFVDIDPSTYLIDIEQIEAAITPKTKAILPVHLYGQAVDMPKVLAIARKHRLAVIEDACQAHGAKFRGQSVGTFGLAGAFSFYPTKNLGCLGDGGMIVTNDHSLAEKIRLLRNYGESKKYHHIVSGFNSRLDTIQAAVLHTKLPYLLQWNQRRNEIAAIYQDKLTDLPKVILPKNDPAAESVFHLYVIRVPNRDGILSYLYENGVYAGIHYPTPLHRMDCFKGLGYRPGDFPHTEKCAESILSLPMYPELNLQQINHVVEIVKEGYHLYANRLRQ